MRRGQDFAVDRRPLTGGLVDLKAAGARGQPDLTPFHLQRLVLVPLLGRGNRTGQTRLHRLHPDQCEACFVYPGAADERRLIRCHRLEREHVAAPLRNGLLPRQPIAVGRRERDREWRYADALRLDDRQPRQAARDAHVDAVHRDVLVRQLGEWSAREDGRVSSDRDRTRKPWHVERQRCAALCDGAVDHHRLPGTLGLVPSQNLFDRERPPGRHFDARAIHRLLGASPPGDPKYESAHSSLPEPRQRLTPPASTPARARSPAALDRPPSRACAVGCTRRFADPAGAVTTAIASSVSGCSQTSDRHRSQSTVTASSAARPGGSHSRSAAVRRIVRTMSPRGLTTRASTRAGWGASTSSFSVSCTSVSPGKRVCTSSGVTFVAGGIQTASRYAPIARAASVDASEFERMTPIERSGADARSAVAVDRIWKTAASGVSPSDRCSQTPARPGVRSASSALRSGRST